MTDPSAYFKAGALDEAIAAAIDQVKSRPTDIGARSFLAELLCFDGQIERADRQLESLGKLEPGTERGVQLFRQILRGETARNEVMRAGRLPELPASIETGFQAQLAALVAIREGSISEAAALLTTAEDGRAPLSGTCDGTAFTEFRDLDDLFAAVIEIITSDGRYFWIPAELLSSLEFSPVATARDLLWRPVEMTLKDGRRGDVFMPALYPFTDGQRAELRLGRETDWNGAEGEPVRGAGRRCFLIGEDDRDILGIDTLDFSS
jgi:type VI secretion system protein ImpE